MISTCGHVFCQQCISSRLADAAQDAEGGSGECRGSALAQHCRQGSSTPAVQSCPVRNSTAQVPPSLLIRDSPSLPFAEEELACRCPRCGTTLKQATLFTRAALSKVGLERDLDFEDVAGAATRPELRRGLGGSGLRWDGVQSTKIHKLMEYLDTVLGLEPGPAGHAHGAAWEGFFGWGGVRVWCGGGNKSGVQGKHGFLGRSAFPCSASAPSWPFC